MNQFQQERAVNAGQGDVMQPGRRIETPTMLQGLGARLGPGVLQRKLAARAARRDQAEAEPAGCQEGAGDAQVFINRCNTARGLVEEASHDWQGKLVPVANAYSDAWEEHTKVLKEVASDKLLLPNFIIQSLLSLIPLNIGAGVSQLLAAAIPNKLATDRARLAVDPLIKKTSLAPAEGSKSEFPTDPKTWKDALLQRFHQKMAHILHVINVLDECAQEDPEFAASLSGLDVLSIVRQELKDATSNIATLPIPDPTGKSPKVADPNFLAHDIERGLWRQWVSVYGYALRATYEDPRAQDGRPSEYTLEDRVSRKIQSRCKAIGMDVAKLVGPAKARVTAEISRRNAILREGGDPRSENDERIDD